MLHGSFIGKNTPGLKETNLLDRNLYNVHVQGRYLQNKLGVRRYYVGDNCTECKHNHNDEGPISKYGNNGGQAFCQPADFSNVTSHTTSYPAIPKRCPFGGSCHTYPTRLQPKLTISQPGDAYEQEADRVAEMVMRVPEACRNEEELCQNVKCTPVVQGNVANSASFVDLPPIVHKVLISPGEALDTGTRSFMEARLGYDFSQVRVHSDRTADESAQLMDALGYTVGSDIVFKAGQYDPMTRDGLHLICHELVHVSQNARLKASALRRTPQKHKKSKPIYEYASKSYEEPEYQMEFSEEERKWIKQVMQLREINLLFRSYNDIPPVILYRVKKLTGGAYGQARNHDVAISGAVYNKNTTYPQKTGKPRPSTEEEKFKSTLIHELIHFVTRQTASLAGKKIVPGTLSAALVYPKQTQFNFPAYAFGWFIHPKSNYILSLDAPDVRGFNPDVTILGTDLSKKKPKIDYEPSPMPQSGNYISPDEDIAQSMSLYLTSADSKQLLMKEYPRRYKMIDWYFKHLGSMKTK